MPKGCNGAAELLSVFGCAQPQMAQFLCGYAARAGWVRALVPAERSDCGWEECSHVAVLVWVAVVQIGALCVCTRVPVVQMARAAQRVGGLMDRRVRVLRCASALRGCLL